MKTLLNAVFSATFICLLLAGCASELNDPADLPSKPTLLGAHGEGYRNIGSDNSHAKDIEQRLGWDIGSCRACHGVDYAGGNTGQGCSSSTCHTAGDGGPEACYVCHGNIVTKKVYPQWYASHKTHLEGGMASHTTIACANCHTLPMNFSDPLHIDKTTPGKAEVHFSNVMAATKTIGTVGTPTFNDVNASCANVYCHGNFTNGNNKTVEWKGSAQAKCGSCHGDEAGGNPLPKAPHLQNANCSGCHTGIIDASGTIIDPTRHVNGILNVFGAERTDW